MLDTTEKREVVPSEFDDMTHSELRLLYQGCQDNIRFAKAIQWRTVGSVLAIFVGLVVACYLLDQDEFFVKCVIGLSFAFSAGAIYALSIYQTWQSTEGEKVQHILNGFSDVARTIDRIKSRMEANIHRGVLFSFMVITILIANYLTVVLLMALYPKS